MLHTVFGNSPHIFLEYGLLVFAYSIFYCGTDRLRKKKNTFGFNVFLALWLALSVEALSVSITLALIIFVLAFPFSGPVYFKLFIAPKLKKELPHHEGH
jgi:hypothetical protein